MDTEETVQRVYDFIEGRTDRMTFEDCVTWLNQMDLERPTQQDLGKDVPYQND